MSALSSRLGRVLGFAVVLCAVVSAGGVAVADDGIQTDDPLESEVNETTNTTNELTSTPTPTETAVTVDAEATLDSETTATLDSETTATLDSETTATLDSETTATLDSETNRSVPHLDDDLNETVNDTLEDASTGVTDTSLVGASLLSTKLVGDSDSTESGQDVAAAQTEKATPTNLEPNASDDGGNTRLAAASSGANEQATSESELAGLSQQPFSETPSTWVPVVGGTVLAVGAAAAMLTPGWTPPFRYSTQLVRRVGLERGSLVDAAKRVVRKPLAILSGLRQHYREDDSPEHELRRSLFETVRDQPGIHLSALSRAVDAPLSTVRYHVRVLEDEGFLRTAKHRGKRRYYPSWVADHELSTALSDPATARLVCALYELESAGVSHLADEIGRDASTVSHHLSRLEQDEIVVRERDGRTVVNRLETSVRESLDENCSKHLC